MMSGYTCRMYADTGVWQALGEDWDRLRRTAADSTPWQSATFLRHWWNELADRRELRVFVVERASRPVLILPLQLTRRPWFGLPMYWLEPIGMLDEVNRPRLGLGEVDELAYSAAFTAIWKGAHEWHGIRLDEKPADDPELALLHGFAQTHGLILRERPFDPAGTISLEQSWPDYLGTRSAKFRKNLRTARRRLESSGNVSLDVFDTAETIDRGFDTLLAVHSLSWKHWPRYGLAQSPGLQRFYRALAHELVRGRAARVLVLSLEGRPIAATFAIMEGDTYYSVEIAHDAGFNRLSPGTVLESIELQGLMDERRYRRFDPMTGAYGNKLKWAESLKPTTATYVLRPTAVSRLFERVEFTMRPMTKGALQRAGLLSWFLAAKERLDALRSRFGRQA